MSRTTAPLSDSACRSAKPTDRAYKLFNGDDLYLLVQPNGREGLTSFGNYLIVGLADARRKGYEMAGDIHLVPLSPQRSPCSSRSTQSQTNLTWCSRAIPSLGNQCPKTVNIALRKMGYDTKTEICGHGFRSMASLRKSENTYERRPGWNP
jgi:hypothetical protein